MIFQYLGLDWLAMCLTFAAIYLLGSKSRSGFSLNARDTRELQQTDTFFHTPRGRLKLREFGDGTAELISYHRADQSGPRLSEYERVACDNPKALFRMLANSPGVRGVVRKKREVALIDRTRVHLDEVEGLGPFVEIEVVLADAETVSAGERIAEELLRELGISRSSLVSTAYIDLMEHPE